MSAGRGMGLCSWWMHFVDIHEDCKDWNLMTVYEASHKTADRTKWTLFATRAGGALCRKLLCICVFVVLFLVTCKRCHHPSSTMRHWVLWLCLCLFYAYFECIAHLLAKYMNMNEIQPTDHPQFGQSSAPSRRGLLHLPSAVCMRCTWSLEFPSSLHRGRSKHFCAGFKVQAKNLLQPLLRVSKYLIIYWIRD